MSKETVFLWAIVAGLAGAALAEDAQWRTGPEHVLVVYAADAPDRDRSGRPDDTEAAEYYAARRGVPAENLLALKLRRQPGRKGPWTYPEFFKRILQPVGQKLSARDSAGKVFAERICYIVLCPGVPTHMITHPPAEKTEKLWWRKTRQRSVDGYLISIAGNLRAGVDAAAAAPGPGLSGPMGANVTEVSLPIYRAYRNPAQAKHFRQLRRLYPKRIDFYLVGRIGVDLKSARDMLDGALYAERHLRLPGPDEAAAMRPEIWLDQKYSFARDHVGALARALLVVRAAKGSPFAAGRGLQRVWPLVIDNESAEIGAMVEKRGPASGPAGVAAGTRPATRPAGARAPHKPTVSARIAPGGVDEKGVTLRPPRRIGPEGTDVPAPLYFLPGAEVTNGKATATVVGLDGRNLNRLLLDSTEGFAAGDTIRSRWPGRWPARNCFIFYGFYGLGRYEDVFQFPPGALGIHVDSACMRWARAAMSRGIAATYGVTTEPLSIGIPYGDQVSLALSAGYDWAEAVYAALRIAQRWTGVVFGDPLYAPFRSAQLRDRTPPVLAEPTVKVAGNTATITARLAGKTPDELADVALFKLEYGRTRKYGQTVEFFDWPEPQNSKLLEGRRFGYSRHFRWTLKGLRKGWIYHYRLTARDPAGLETVTADASFAIR